MTAWVELAAAFAAFTGSHALPARPALRRRLTDLLGTRLYLLLYSAISLLLLWWLIAAAGRAPYVPLWEPAAWQVHTVMLAMAAACILVALAVGRPNPFSFGGGDPARFDPQRPGIVGLTRHPILLAAALWAGAHLLANGDLAHVLLFGAFLGMALTGMAALDRRARSRHGGDRPKLAALRGPTLLPGDALRLALAALLFAALLLLHPAVIGVDPLAAF
ncbi:MAG: NnrU family protein [Geminicoccaceae bacterium]